MENKGFSLIETLVAITITSIAVMALMKVISHSSTTSANVIERFNSSIMMGVVAADVNESHYGREINAGEILLERYNIDHPTIRETLQSSSYEIRLLNKETIDPLANLVLGSITSKAHNTIAIEKVVLQNSKEKKSFFHLTSGER